MKLIVLNRHQLTVSDRVRAQLGSAVDCARAQYGLYV